MQPFISENISIDVIFITHAHLDHVFDVDIIRSKTNARVYMHKDENVLLEDCVSEAKKFQWTFKPFQAPDIFCKDGDSIMLGEVVFEVIHVPGHTPGSICLKWENGIFTGDTLMYRNIGDCTPGYLSKYTDSIKRKLFTLPDSLVVYPGHNRNTTIGEEKKQNTGMV